MDNLTPVGYASEKLASCDARRLSIAEELQVKRDNLVKQLAEVDKSIELFTAHPEFEQCLTQLARTGIYR